MTEALNDRRVRYVATASQTSFDVDFPIETDADVAVYQKVDATGAVNLLVLTTDYTVTLDGAAPNTADVDLVTGAAVGDIITIEGTTPVERDTDFTTGGDYLAGTVNNAEDRQYRIDQEQNRDLDRMVIANRVSPDALDTTLPDVVDQGGQFLSLASDGLSFLWSTIASIGTAVVSDATPELLGDEGPGTSDEISRADHVHGRDVGDPGNEGSGINIGGVIWSYQWRVNDINEGKTAERILHRHSTTIECVDIAARANSDTSSHAAVTASMPLWSLYAAGWTGAEYNLFTAIKHSASGNGTINDASSPGKMEFQVTADGAVVPTTALTIHEDKHLQLEAQIQEKKGADVASATALPILKDGNTFNVTGTTETTSINTTGQVGTVIKLHAVAAWPITHDGDNIIVAGGASYTAEAGDEFEFTEYAAGKFRMTGYALADGGSIVASAGGETTAWVNFNGTGVVAIRDDFNVSSITDNAVGQYTVNFTATYANANYATQATLLHPGGATAIHGAVTDITAAPTTSSVGIISLSSAHTSQDSAHVYVSVCGGN